MEHSERCEYNFYVTRLLEFPFKKPFRFYFIGVIGVLAFMGRVDIRETHSMPCFYYFLQIRKISLSTTSLLAKFFVSLITASFANANELMRFILLEIGKLMQWVFL